MDFLLDNPLATMEGPVFLVLYAFVILFSVIAVAIVRSNADKTDQLNIPAIPPDPDPYEIAFLRAGLNEAARSVIFSLLRRGLIKIEPDSKKSVIKPASLINVNGLPPIEQTTLEWIGMFRNAEDVFAKNDGLVAKLEPFFFTYRQQLETRQLLTSHSTASRMKRYGWTAAILIGGLGGYKIVASIAYGYFSFAFTFIMGAMGLAILAAVGNLPRVTKLGKRYLERLKIAFEGIKSASSIKPDELDGYQATNTAAFASVDPILLSVGVFGGGILAGTAYGNYNTAFEKAERQQTASGSSGCGSGSACGSSCSSGSDGGGSSCGSGCGGGCGGGGCGG